MARQSKRELRKQNKELNNDLDKASEDYSELHAYAGEQRTEIQKMIYFHASHGIHGFGTGAGGDAKDPNPKLNNAPSNMYPTREEKIKEIIRKFEGSAKFGNVLTSNIIEIRSALVMAEGVEPIVSEERRLEDGSEEATPDADGATDGQFDETKPRGSVADPEETEGEQEKQEDDFSITRKNVFAEEREFIESFIRLNKWDGEGSKAMAQNVELEGGVLLRLRPVMDDNGAFMNVAVDIISEESTDFTLEIEWNKIDGEENENAGIKEVRYESQLDDDAQYTLKPKRDLGTKRKIITIPGEEVVFVKFRSKSGEKFGMPKMGMVLELTENIEFAYKNWRVLNTYHAYPQDVWEFEKANDAKEFHNDILEKKPDWGRGRAVTLGGGTFKREGLSGDGHKSLGMEIDKDIQILAGSVNIPPLMLGFPQFNSNRSTGEEQSTPVQVTSEMERITWQAGLTDAFDKAIRMANKFKPFGRLLREGIVKANLKALTAGEMRLIIDLYKELVLTEKYPLLYFYEILPKQLHSAEETMTQLANEKATRSRLRVAGGTTDNDEFDETAAASAQPTPEQIAADAQAISDAKEPEPIPVEPTT